MEATDFKSNSHRSRETTEEKKVEKVISGGVKTKKKNEVRKFTDAFLSDDIHNVKSYVLMDVLIPSLKKAVSDIVTNGIDMMLFGEVRDKGRRSSSGNVSYRNYYDDKKDDRRDRSSSRSRSVYDFNEIVVDTKGEAEDVLDSMEDLIKRYGTVSVADLYDLVGVTGAYTDNKYGWTDIRNADSVRCRDGGYALKLPRAVPII